MIARVLTAAIIGIEAQTVEAEVRVKGGIPRFTIIGLGDGAVRESRDRVLAAIRHAELPIKAQILVNLAPAELRKEGSSFDLPIAIGILAACGYIPPHRLERFRIHGELSLDGSLKPVRGTISLAVEALRNGAAAMIVPRANAAEAALITGLPVYGVQDLREVAAFLRDEIDLETERGGMTGAPPPYVGALSDVWGQEGAKRALVIAAAGAHNLLMVGPPGCGKSMLASRLPSILPPLEDSERLDVVRVHSVAGLPVAGLLAGIRPFRNPHHGISDAGLIGGGGLPRPGEISLAHHGVLFLDELPEFRRSAIEALRAPIEEGHVTVIRARGRTRFPARFQLLAAMNPCPCGRLTGYGGACLCSRPLIQGYLRRLSQPILDRIDLHIDLDPVPISVIARSGRAPEVDCSEDRWRRHVVAARRLQLLRQGRLNVELDARALGDPRCCEGSALRLLELAATKTALSVRGYTRLLRVARTIADLEEVAVIQDRHVAEALSFRSLERIERYAQAA